MIRTVPKPRILTLTVAAAMAALPVGSAWGNMAAPPEPQTVHRGSPLGEPAGGLRDVFIEHETLRMDLRPLAKARPAIVEAVYRVRNDGAARTLDLVFVANGLAKGATTVSVDGRAVAATPGAAASLPASWRAPATTPSLAEVDTANAQLPYEPRNEGTLAFRVSLPAGRHEIRVRYPAEASAFQDNDLTPVWQLGYVLAPARDWAGFGALDVRVELPRGWKAESNLTLRSEGSALAGTFRGVPADAIALSVQKPEPASGVWYLLWFVFATAVLGLCAWAAWRVGGSLGRRGKSSAWALPASAGMTVAWTIAAAIGWSFIPNLVEWQAGPYVGEYAVRSLSYGSTMLLLLLIPLMLLSGIITLQVAAFLARKRTLARDGQS
ncbi:hypothetical protein [Longimicrobium sp.]|uniref:hypothetical protein n=1 Tax=Longimicrobium sp. TaxID=2029185 RepID=UPI002C25B6B5|nr:hypothetical protein [Longimicrobium sp.]HSU13113.1 hypothetical protein [Longimicrobium sp.]